MRLQLIACVIARRSVASGVKYFMRFSILSYLRRDQGFLNSFWFYTIFRYSECKYHVFYATVIISFLVHRRSLMHFCIFICASEFIQTNHQRPLFFFLFLYVGKSSPPPHALESGWVVSEFMTIIRGGSRVEDGWYVRFKARDCSLLKSSNI